MTIFIPLQQLHDWLKDEQQAGAPKPQQAILSTVGVTLAAHGRVVAIREINEHGLLFFTQRATRKVDELLHHPQACLTFWLELYQREVIIEGKVAPLSQVENEAYWQSYPREAQIRFSSYAPTSSQPISSKSILEVKRQDIERQFSHQPIPLDPYYCGFRLMPIKFIFYAYRVDELSDVYQYTLSDEQWTKEWLSP